MKFPGSKLLHTWDLSTQSLSLEELLRSCEQVSLTGFAEIQFPGAVGMIFYYLGAEVNAVYREGTAGCNGTAALEQLRGRVQERSAFISVYELPLDMAHLLRGVVNRRKLEQKIRGRAALAPVLGGLEDSQHTGTLEVQTSAGQAMILLVSGRASNVYWETPAGLTFEKKEARQKLDEALDKAEGTLYLSDFSRDVWKGRHEVQATPTRLRRLDPEAPSEQLAGEESAIRREILEELSGQVPGMLQAMIVDLLTGVVLARQARGTAALKVGLLAEKVPSLTMYLKDLVAADDDQMELVELSTDRVSTLVVVIPDAQEAVAVIADKSQPTALIGGTLARLARVYAARVRPARGPGVRA